MLSKFINLTLFSVLLINLVESKPAGDCQKCLANSIDYIDHYKYLNCKAVPNKDCPQCIERFDCPRLPLEDKKLDDKRCYVSNLTYAIGESIMLKRQFCKYCTCVDVPLPPTGTSESAEEPTTEYDESEEETNENSDSNFTNLTAVIMNRPLPKEYKATPVDTNYEARITCAVSSMPFTSLVNSPESKDYCYYKENECYSTKHCISKEKLEKENCQYKDKKYAFGEIIHPEEEDHCLKCKCSSSWTNNISQMVKQCERISCDLEDNSLNQGCIPIYENKCCPNNYHCPLEEKPKEPEPVKIGKCYFNGKNYDVGSKLNTDNACLDCDCRIPPYFTCILKEKCGE